MRSAGLQIAADRGRRRNPGATRPEANRSWFAGSPVCPEDPGSGPPASCQTLAKGRVPPGTSGPDNFYAQLRRHRGEALPGAPQSPRSATVPPVVEPASQEPGAATSRGGAPPASALRPGRSASVRKKRTKRKNARVPVPPPRSDTSSNVAHPRSTAMPAWVPFEVSLAEAHTAALALAGELGFCRHEDRCSACDRLLELTSVRRRRRP